MISIKCTESPKSVLSTVGLGGGLTCLKASGLGNCAMVFVINASLGYELCV